MSAESISVTLPVPDSGVHGYFVQVTESGTCEVTEAVDFAWIVGDHEDLDSSDEFLAT